MIETNKQTIATSEASERLNPYSCLVGFNNNYNTLEIILEISENNTHRFAILWYSYSPKFTFLFREGGYKCMCTRKFVYFWTHV